MIGTCSGTHIVNQGIGASEAVSEARPSRCAVASERPNLLCVPPAEAGQFIPFAEPLLKSAIAHTGIGDYGEIREGILAGNHLLWLAIEPDGAIMAAASTQLQAAPIGRVCVITACGGRAIRQWLHLVSRIETYAADEGCEAVRYFGRPGWLRELEGWKQIGVIADKIIKNS